MIKNGVIGVGEQESDFLICGDTPIPEIKLQDEKRFEYNQGSSNDCTLYGPIGAISDLMNYEFSKEEIKEINELSYSRGRIRGEGRYTQSGVKCVCDWWNSKYPNKVVGYFRLDLTDERVKEALEKNHTVVITYKGNADYNLDYMKDISLDKDYHGKPTYGHCTTMIKGPSIKDSYKGRETKYGKCNIYDIKANIENLIKNKEYYRNCYLILPTGLDKIEEMKRLNTMRLEVNKAIEAHSELWAMTNDKEYKDFLHDINNKHRQKLKDIETEFNKIQ